MPLVKAIEIDEFQNLVTVTSSQMQAAEAADAVEATAIATDVEKGTKAGFGLLILAGSPVVCLVALDQVEAQRNLLLSHADKIAAEIGASPTLSTTSAEGAFSNAERGQCAAIYASAVDMKVLVTALKRDGVNHRFSSLWITPEEVKAADDRLTSAKAAAEHQAAERQSRQVEEQRLASLKAADEAAKLSSAQAASREKYGAAAKAAAASVAQEVKDFAEHADEHDRVAERLFPVFAASYRNDLSDRWELMNAK